MRCAHSPYLCGCEIEDSSARGRSCRLVVCAVAGRHCIHSVPSRCRDSAAFTTSGSNQCPLRSRKARIACSGLRSSANTSRCCATAITRASGEIDVSLARSGYPLPSQCSSSDRTACAVSSLNPILRTILAPRSHRSWIISWLLRCCVIANVENATEFFYGPTVWQDLVPEKLQGRQAGLVRLGPVLQLHSDFTSGRRRRQ